MIKVIGFKERQKENGELFFVLEVQGGIEMVLSQSTSNYYTTDRKAIIHLTFLTQRNLL